MRAGLAVLVLLVGCGDKLPASEPVAVEPASLHDLGPMVRIVPDVAEIPSNGVRFKLYWNSKMRLGPHATKILDAAGTPLPDAVPRLSWNFTMMSAEVDPVGLEAGKSYILHVAGFEGADGQAANPVDKKFRVIAADTTSPSGKDLVVRGRPLPATSATLTLAFPEPMDPDSTIALTVLCGAHPVDGQWAMDTADRVATFTPASPWGSDPIRVSIGAGLKDLAANELVDRPTGFMIPSAPPLAVEGSPVTPDVAGQANPATPR